MHYTATAVGCSIVGLGGSDDDGEIDSVPSVCCFAKLINT